ncbi:hypothetical protein DRN58_04570 [Thermococci archaeon]|nr:MAG: hypothetical protein DRN58_04570 [Thermococci archaeon]
MSKTNDKYVGLGILLIIVGAVLYYGAEDIVPYPKTNYSKITYTIEGIETAWNEKMRAIDRYYDTVQKVMSLGEIIGLIGLILLIVAIVVPHMAKLEMGAIKEERDDQMDTITKILETYNDKGYKIMKYEFEEPILKVILSKGNKKYLASFNLKTRKAKYRIVEDKKQEE